MLAIRMQRTGRRGHAQFRLVVQDRRFSPTSGRIVAYLGSYDPHTKKATLDTEQAANYLANGARPSDRVARLLTKEGLKLPDWVELAPPKKRSIKHPEKLRRNRPPTAEPQPATETAQTQPVEEIPTETSAKPDQPAEPPVVEIETKTTEAAEATSQTAATSPEPETEPADEATDKTDPAAKK